MTELDTPEPPTRRNEAADALWNNWDIPPRKPTIPHIHVEGFDGPMDLLLDLAERQRLDLGRISILQLADQFVAAMTALGTAVPMNRRANWLEQQLQPGRAVFARPAPPGPAREPYRPVLFRAWPVAETRARILALLEQRQDRAKPLSLLDCLPPAPLGGDAATPRRALLRRAAISSVFCAALELEKDGTAMAIQATPLPTVLSKAPTLHPP